MKKYQKQNRNYFLGALICVFISTVFAVTLQFLKGDVLDYAIAGETAQTGRYAVLLIAFIFYKISSHNAVKDITPQRFGAAYHKSSAKLLITKIEKNLT